MSKNKASGRLLLSRRSLAKYHHWIKLNEVTRFKNAATRRPASMLVTMT